ncbi:MAG: lipid-A-disaccharide synthase [Bryobacterales bacterium]|jgi:lipid-A-disaccharide synthase|nr:lipid-A-disaccharide synthase [Bryobacterales bacterium]
MRPKILISAGEASGEMYATQLVEALRARFPDADFFGCAGPKMRAVGVRPVIQAEALSVVGLVEVLAHIPRIYGEYRKLLRAARQERPHLAILTDSPDFHFRVARQLKRMGVPVVYYVAPQVWAWRQGRTRLMRDIIDLLVCIFPFEESFFRQRGVNAMYAGHPLTRMFRPTLGKREFLRHHGLADDVPLLGLLPGSRTGEWARHLPVLLDAVDALRGKRDVQCALAVPPAGFPLPDPASWWKRFSRQSIQVIEADTWNLLAHADVVLAASGTVTVEAALAGVPMVTFYKVSPLSWKLGRRLVKVPHLTMVNLIAGERVVPEFMQDAATGQSLAAAVDGLLAHPDRMAAMRQDLLRVRALLSGSEDPIGRAADAIASLLDAPAVPAADSRTS